MRLSDLFEGRVKDAYMNGTYYNTPAPTPPVKEFNYYLLVNGKQWGQFESEKHAIAAGDKIRSTKPWLRIDVMPR